MKGNNLQATKKQDEDDVEQGTEIIFYLVNFLQRRSRNRIKSEHGGEFKPISFYFVILIYTWKISCQGNKKLTLKRCEEHQFAAKTFPDFQEKLG